MLDKGDLDGKVLWMGVLWAEREMLDREPSGTTH